MDQRVSRRHRAGPVPPVGQLVAVRCPSVLCQNMLVALDGGAIGAHSSLAHLGQCTWSGVGIHDDREGG
ncbi:hypothetical protein ACQP1G_42455 [Nocardia sp. CA-107356]|uniref:hypothetical protein n=1 Tax=Nocardia sp. CA-107356 TaxID=3239972 RepID=UPI003D8E694E